MYITTAEAGHVLGITPRRVVDLIYDTRLPAEQVNGRWFIKQSDLQLPSVRHRPRGRPPGRRTSPSPLPYQPTPKYMREHIFWRDGAVCQLCQRNDKDTTYVVAHIIARGPSCPANLFVSCRGCNVRQGQQTWIPQHFDSITEHCLHWRSWVRYIASLPQEQQQINISRDLHYYASGLF